jgi:hypothetical protein
MKKVLICGVALALSAMVVPVASARGSGDKSASRQETQEYSLPRSVGADTDLGLVVGRVTFEASSARSLELTIADTASPNVLGRVRQGETVLDTFCTQSARPIKVAPNVPVEVELYIGTCGGLPSFITVGSVTATFKG